MRTLNVDILRKSLKRFEFETRLRLFHTILDCRHSNGEKRELIPKGSRSSRDVKVSRVVLIGRPGLHCKRETRKREKIREPHHGQGGQSGVFWVCGLVEGGRVQSPIDLRGA